MWRRLLRLGPTGWFEVAEAQFWVVWASLLVRLVPKGRLVSPTPPPSEDSTPSNAPTRPDAWTARADRLARAVSRACRYGILRPECLVRSIALQRMLRLHGVREARVRFGVRHRDGEFQSHAWVVCGDRVVGDDARHVRTFTTLDTLSVPDALR